MSEIERLPKEILRDLVTASNAMTALMISKEGHSMAEAGNTSFINTTAMAALVAGMFAATREVARMVGENQFSMLLQQGEKRHIHISLVTDATMLIVVFEDYQKVGLIRHEARKACKDLYTSLTVESKKQEELKEVREEELAMPTFKEYALNLIDRIFETDD